MSTFELIAETEPGRARGPGYEGLGQGILLENAHWFTRVRWIVVAIFALVGLAARGMPGLFERIGIHPPGAWILQLAGAVAVLNVVFALLARRLNDRSPLLALQSHLWLQIVVDLFAVTVMVHNVGSVTTFVSFAYLFHIVLACIFFSRRHSFAVTILATALYLACVGLEIAGEDFVASIFLDASPIRPLTARTAVLIAVSAVFVWFVVWYFAATLSLAVRQRDAELLRANEQLVEADHEKNRIVVRTVHDLKAPFSGIESNIALMRMKFWDEIPPSVRELVDRISVRSKALRERIRDILELSDLRSGHSRSEPRSPIALREFLEEVAAPLKGAAEARRVQIAISSPSIRFTSEQRRLAVLVSNILANAISYSQPEGTVDVTAREESDAVVLCVSDHGIGIDEEALPHIFDEYYRSREAAAFNRASTGLGLAIVKEVAQQLDVRITVSSEHGKGTTFTMRIPRKEEDTKGENQT